MARQYDRRCTYCNLPITMRQMPDGWLPFEGNKRHNCKAKKGKWKRSASLSAIFAVGIVIVILLLIAMLGRP